MFTKLFCLVIVFYIILNIFIYKNYLHVYSYHDGSNYRNNNKYTKKTGFISFDISKYEGKILNLQITATKGGTTSIYINGDVQNPVTFTSGNKNIKYNKDEISVPKALKLYKK